MRKTVLYSRTRTSIFCTNLLALVFQLGFAPTATLANIIEAEANYSFTIQEGSPNDVTFADVTAAAAGTVTTSGSVTLSGFLSALPISVTGDGTPEYRIGAGSWTSLPGTVLPGSSVTLRLTSATWNDSRTATLVVGSKSFSFRVNTPVFTTQTFSYTGASQNFVVPVSGTYQITARGGKGGNSAAAGGLGGQAIGRITLTAGETLIVNVGGQGTNNLGGWNGGGTGGTSTTVGRRGGGGGGASDVRRNGAALINRIIVAGGGGGGGGGILNSFGDWAKGSGGGGGGGGYYGGGGAGGAPANSCTAGAGTAGTLGSGGNGGAATCVNTFGNLSGPGAGGAGGGLTGNSVSASGLQGGGGTQTAGGTGGSAGSDVRTAGGGGGGSSYIAGLTSASTTAAVNTGNGSVTIQLVTP